MIDEQKIYLILEMAEAAIEELKNQGENIKGLQRVAQAAIVAEVEKGRAEVLVTAKQEKKQLNRFILALNLKFFALASATVFCTVFAIIFVAHANVWWERSKLESLKAEQASMNESLANQRKLKGHINVIVCGDENIPCVEVDTKQAYGKGGRYKFFPVRDIR